MFHGVASGRVRMDGCEFDVHLHDVETLNRMAMDGVYDVTKLSFHAWLGVSGSYEMLGVGAALGFGCGPVVVSRRDIAPADLPRCRLAVPGKLTTAHLLVRLWAPDVSDKVFVGYDRVMGMVASGEADAGVIIHEGRFIYERQGLRLVADLGQWWQDKTRLPIPLGCIAARKGLGAETTGGIEQLLRRSIRESLDHPDLAAEYVRRHAQEMDPDVLAEHIRTFVNDYSLDIGDDGRRAVDKLRELARGAGIIA